MGADEHEPAAPVWLEDEGAAHSPERLDLHEEDRLPWLESAEDYEHEGEVDGRKVMAVVLGALALLAAVVGGIWWGTHRHAQSAAAPADGATVTPPQGPIKEAPKDPGGKTFAGTGDTSYAVSEGQTRPAQLAGEGADGAAKAPSPAPAKPAASASPAKPAPAATADGDSSAIGVQVGAYGNRAAAEAGWNKLVMRSELLKGVKHRIVEGQADIGTVYRLQALPGDTAAATALCDKLKAAGIACHLRH
jgi:hypothetical protein